MVKHPTRDLALAGVVTGIAGIVAAQATSWILRAENPPVVAVASVVRDETPGRLAHELIKLVGHADKPLLIIGTTVILLGICAWVGTLAGRRPLLADLVYVALAVIGLLAVRRLDDSTAGSYFAVVVGLITWIVVNRFLTGPLLKASPPDTVAADAEPADAPVATEASDAAEATGTGGGSRRTFLLRSGGVLAVTFAGGVLARLSSEGRRKVEEARRLLRLPVTTGLEPAGVNLGGGIEPWRTPNEDFYQIHTVFTPPTISPKDWTLRIHGMVEKEITLDYSDLVARSITEAWVTLCCVSNEVGGDLIGNAWWSGVLIRDVLAQARPEAGADAVLQTSHDGWNCATPLAALTDPDRNAMLALGMNGKPLPIEHGFPVRMVVPGLYGYVSATKWLVDLEVTRFDEVDAYWTQRGWSEKGPVLTQSRIDVPRDGEGVQAGAVRIGGSAWAQHTGIEAVEYQVDGGAWQQARLGRLVGLDTWVQWAGEIDVGKGGHTLVVRATDKSGYTQTSVRTDVAPSGATGWHTIEFDAD